MRLLRDTVIVGSVCPVYMNHHFDVDKGHGVSDYMYKIITTMCNMIFYQHDEITIVTTHHSHSYYNVYVSIRLKVSRDDVTPYRVSKGISIRKS